MQNVILKIESNTKVGNDVYLMRLVGDLSKLIIQENLLKLS